METIFIPLNMIEGTFISKLHCVLEISCCSHVLNPGGGLLGPFRVHITVLVFLQLYKFHMLLCNILCTR